MIRRKKQKVLASSYPGLAFPKGQPRAEVKVNRRALETARIKSVRAEVWRRSRRCERCFDTEAMTVQRLQVGKFTHELHETYPRSKTRGMTPNCRFDARWCLRLCPGCHKAVTAHEIQTIFDSLDRGANGQMLWTSPNYTPIKGWYTAEQVWRHITGWGE